MAQKGIEIMADGESRDIPLPIKREVRQRCGFGCVMCGLPLYEYEHMLGYADVKRHVADEITLLCDKHHKERTNGLLPIGEVERANANPYNLREGISKPYDLHYSGKECEAIIGSNRFMTKDVGHGTAMYAVVVDNIPLVGFELADGHLLLNVNFLDEFNNFVLRIVNNELVYSSDPWDIELVGRNLIIREAHRQLLLDITFEVPNRIRIERGRLLCNGVEILVRPDNLLITNNSALISGNSAIGTPLGLVIGRRDIKAPACIYMPSIRRYLGDNSEAIRWARENMKVVRSQQV